MFFRMVLLYVWLETLSSNDFDFKRRSVSVIHFKNCSPCKVFFTFSEFSDVSRYLVFVKDSFCSFVTRYSIYLLAVDRAVSYGNFAFSVAVLLTKK